jgi:hypothetical protein
MGCRSVDDYLNSLVHVQEVQLVTWKGEYLLSRRPGGELRKCGVWRSEDRYKWDCIFGGGRSRVRFFRGAGFLDECRSDGVYDRVRLRVCCG